MARSGSSLLNEETRQPASTGAVTCRDGVPTLTIALHPDLTRLGERAHFGLARPGQRIALSRAEPEFRRENGLETGPISDPYVSRTPAWLQLDDGGLSLDPRGTSTQIAVDGRVVSQPETFSADRLRQGVLIELSRRVLLIAHIADPAPIEPDWQGLVGASDAMRGLRMHVGIAASHDRPVVVLGESGSGKELVSRAIHDLGRRASGPYVAVNMAAVTGDTVISELFGHVRGAFTGAGSARPGLFRQAHGGTLFLDEIGETSSAVQAMLLRVLETGEVRPLGTDAASRVDVRLITATDADLARAQQDGRFKSPLWHRIASSEIRVPPLRERLGDIPRLWVRFLAEEMAGDAPLWLARPAAKRLWIEPALMQQLLRYRFPGNVRELRNLARRVAVESRHQGDFVIPESCRQALIELFAGGEPTPPQPTQPPSTPSLRPPPAAQPAREEAAPPRADARQLGDEQLIAALRENAFKMGATARQLGISKTTLYRLIDQSTTLRKARDISREELEAAHQQCQGDAERMAAQLQVSVRGITLRVKELGL